MANNVSANQSGRFAIASQNGAQRRDHMGSVFAMSAQEDRPAEVISVDNVSMSSDYPTPGALTDTKEFVWDEDDLVLNNYRRLGQRLAAAGDLFRRPGYASGLLLVSQRANIEPVVIDTARRLAAVVVDRIRVRVLRGGNTRGQRIPATHLNTMLASELFLQQFRPVDDVVRIAHYLPDFGLPVPGYNDGGPGQRVLFVGPSPRVEPVPDSINKFLDVMAFATNADRTNAVAAALTVLLRNHWAGAKPLIAVTSSKSHGGKDTVIHFAAGNTSKVSIDYESTDWAFRQGFVAALKAHPEAGVVNVENARLGKRDKFVASATLERFLTDPEPVLHSSRIRDGLSVRNHLVLFMSTNFGSICEDLWNRALPIHLNPTGNVADRKSPIGNPKLQFLPAHRDRIEAELRGIVEKWKGAGRPLDTSVNHPFTGWAHTIGGILQVSGFRDFLANYSLRRTIEDPLRNGLGLLGAARPGEWLRAGEWARLSVKIGVVKVVIPERDRDSDAGRERGVGKVLSNHLDETFEIETDGEKLTLKLEKDRRRFERGEISTRYRFFVISRAPVPVNEAPSTVQS